MPDFNELVTAVKKAALEGVEATNPTALAFGTVVSTSPLKISTEQKMTLSTAQLILTRNVTDFETEVTVDWVSEERSGGGGDDAFASHNHGIVGRKPIIVHNALVVGDMVVMVRMQGGQKFLVLDRVVGL